MLACNASGLQLREGLRHGGTFLHCLCNRLRHSRNKAYTLEQTSRFHSNQLKAKIAVDLFVNFLKTHGFLKADSARFSGNDAVKISKVSIGSELVTGGTSNATFT